MVIKGVFTQISALIRQIVPEEVVGTRVEVVIDDADVTREVVELDDFAVL